MNWIEILITAIPDFFDPFVNIIVTATPQFGAVGLSLMMIASGVFLTFWGWDYLNE